MRLADAHLALFFTDGVSLRDWERIGMLERELALYRQLQQELGALTFATYGGPRERECADALNGIQLVHNRLGLPRWLYRWRLPRHPAFRPGAVQIVKTNQMPGADVARQVAQRTGARLVVRCGYLHAEFLERQFGVRSLRAWRARRLERRVFEAADRIILTTDAMKESVLARYAVAADRIVVIPNYVQTDRFRPPASPPTNDPPRFGCVGRLVKQKNLRHLLSAIEGLPLALDIVGTGPLQPELETLARTHSLPVRFHGNLPHERLPAFLQACDAFVLPSLYEGHPKALLEAMSCALPCIGADRPGIANLLRHGETGLLCDTDPPSIRAALQHLLEHPAEAGALGAAARREVEATFALARIVERECALYRELLHDA